ncbi:MAG TPA: sugar transferase [Desulfomonilaceae bacterium]|nr:sugar transferase [Desulfomonilaceae bacterium]
MYKEYQPYKHLLMGADLVVTVAILATMVELRPFLPGKDVLAGDVLPSSFIYLMVALLWHMLFALTGVYHRDKLASLPKQLSRFTSAYSMVVLMFAGLLYFTFRDLSRMLVVYFCTMDYLALVFLRCYVHYLIKYKHAPLRGSATLIAGAGENAQKLAETLLTEHSAVARLVGFAADSSGGSSNLPAPFLGTLDNIHSLVQQYKVEIVMIALPDEESAEMDRLIFRLEALPVRVYIIPDMLKLALVHADVETFGDLVAIGIREPVIRGHRKVFKRIMDVVLSAALLLVLWPLLVAVWILIKLDSPGPVMYVAKRVGENGKIFDMYKFRTMFMGAEDHQSEITSTDGQSRPIYKVKNDPRVTRVGRVLRRTSIDELPQLFNVLIGNMSLVGPRPEQPFITEQYDQLQWRRLSVPPGITGWWQVSGRSDLAMHLNSQYDIYYVRNYSILLDLRILVKTIGAVIKGKGAY